MIILPPGFDYLLLLSDFFKLSLPFVVVAGLFAAYRLIRKGMETI